MVLDLNLIVYFHDWKLNPNPIAILAVFVLSPLEPLP